MLRGLARLDPALSRAGAFLLLAGLVLGAWWIFRAAGQDYLAFWLDAGPLIGLATASFGWAWGGGLDRNPALVSADPLHYAGAAMQVAGMPLIVFGAHMQRCTRDRRLSARDTVLVVPLATALAVAILGWLLLVAPAQYFAFLFAGAPSRMAMASGLRLYARMEGTQLRYVDAEALGPAGKRKEDGWWDASMRDRPVTVASAFMAAALLVIDSLA